MYGYFYVGKVSAIRPALGCVQAVRSTKLFAITLGEDIMKLSKTLIASSVAAVMAAGVMAPAQAEVEVGASVGVANTYLWRGYDLGSGTPAVSGDLNLSASGFYTGIWASSGDTAAGSEYDLYLGYGGSFGDFSYDLSVWNYNYPTGAGYLDDEDTAELEETNFGDLSDVVLSLGYGPVAITYYDNVAGGSGYSYATLAVEAGSFGFLVGQHFEDTNELTHFDLSYAYNDNLSFTISAPIGSNDGDIVDGEMIVVDEDPTFVVSYSLPLGE